MGHAPAFQFYAAEYLADENVQLMTLDEEGAYIRLLAYCWREGSVPADPILAGRLCKGASPELMAPVLARFVPVEAGRLVHPRLERERQKQEAFRAKMSVAGKHGNEIKHGISRVGGRVGEHEAVASDRSSSSSSSSSSGTTTPPASAKIAEAPPASDTSKPKKVTTEAPGSMPRGGKGGSLPGMGEGGVVPIPQKSALGILDAPKRFQKPTPEQVDAYAAEVGYHRPNLGPAFCDHYEAGGWKIGTKPMKDWKAAVRTWKHRDAQGGPNGRSDPKQRITGSAGYQPGKYAKL